MTNNAGTHHNGTGNDDDYNPKCMRCYFFESCKRDGCLMGVHETKCYDFIGNDDDERIEELRASTKKWLEDRWDMIDRLEEEDYWDKD